MNRLFRIVGVVVAAGVAAAAIAQVSLPGVPLPRLPPVTDPVTGTLRTATSALEEARKLHVRELLRSERATVEADPDGQPILRRQVGALSPTPEALERARVGRLHACCAPKRSSGLGLTLVVLQAPEGLSTRRALQKLRELDPQGQYDFNHLYLGSGARRRKPAAASRHDAGRDAGAAGEWTAHRPDRQRHRRRRTPCSRAPRSCAMAATGAIFPAPHGTAVASLLVGQGEGFESVIPGATLYAADIFCGHGGGSLSLLALALDWMAREKIPVVNISLVGAKSILLTGLVRAMTARGFLLVAAVGNDGPTAPPLYPAAYPDVVGVTGVDAKRRVLPEACRGEQVDFAAAGAGFEAAAVGGGFEPDARHVLRDADRRGAAGALAPGAGSRTARAKSLAIARIDGPGPRQQRRRSVLW